MPEKCNRYIQKSLLRSSRNTTTHASRCSSNQPSRPVNVGTGTLKFPYGYGKKFSALWSPLLSRPTGDWLSGSRRVSAEAVRYARIRSGMRPLAHCPKLFPLTCELSVELPPLGGIVRGVVLACCGWYPLTPFTKASSIQ